MVYYALEEMREGSPGFTGAEVSLSPSVHTTRYRSHDEALGCHTHVNQVK